MYKLKSRLRSKLKFKVRDYARENVREIFPRNPSSEYASIFGALSAQNEWAEWAFSSVAAGSFGAALVRACLTYARTFFFEKGSQNFLRKFVNTQ